MDAVIEAWTLAQAIQWATSHVPGDPDNKDTALGSIIAIWRNECKYTFPTQFAAVTCSVRARQREKKRRKKTLVRA